MIASPESYRINAHLAREYRGIPPATALNLLLATMDAQTQTIMVSGVRMRAQGILQYVKRRMTADGSHVSRV